MLALILKHKTTRLGVLILHTTHEPVLVGDTPLSAILLRDYSKGFRFFVYDRSVHKRREKIVPSKNLEKFMATGVIYYAYADMTIEQKEFVNTEVREISIDGTMYKLKEIQNDR
jgi:hypothetical protein